jgi:hypothetical protein
MTLLRTLVWIFGATCCVIALVHIAYGPSSIPGSVPVNATMDSEDRFYATLFLGFGAALIWSSKDLNGRQGMFHCLLAVFFLGGVSRTVSAYQVGLPNLLFQVLWAIELILPVIMYFWLKAVSTSHQDT